LSAAPGKKLTLDRVNMIGPNLRASGITLCCGDSFCSSGMQMTCGGASPFSSVFKAEEESLPFGIIIFYFCCDAVLAVNLAAQEPFLPLTIAYFELA